MNEKGRCFLFGAAFVVLLLTMAGCEEREDAGVDRLWDDSAKVPLLEPFAGKWTLDEDRTYKAWRDAGMSAEDVAEAREGEAKMRESLNTKEISKALQEAGVDMKAFQLAHSKMHADLTFASNAATGAGLPAMEYRFYNLHRHGETVCGKAWHHEDKDDPGDMSKCYVQLSLVNSELHLKMRMQDGEVDLEDPDFKDPPEIVNEAAAERCDAEKPAGEDWDDWTTYVFVRPGSGIK